MERVGILLNKLMEQYQQGGDVQKMLVNAQMLYTELLLEKQHQDKENASFVAVTANGNFPLYQAVEQPLAEQPVQQRVEVQQQPIAPAQPKPVIEETVEPQVEQPAAEESHAAEAAQPGKLAAEPVVVAEVQKEDKPIDIAGTFVYDTAPSGLWNFDPVDVPTLAQQEKIVYELKDVLATDTASLNDTLKEEKRELGSALLDTPIRDLKKAISINERHQFINVLFRGDETMYERSIKTINNFSIFAEAEYWIQRELKLKLGWDSRLPEVKLFDQLVKRRFS